MEDRRTEAHALYARVARRWSAQVRAYQRSVLLYRQINDRLAGRRRAAMHALEPARVGSVDRLSTAAAYPGPAPASEPDNTSFAAAEACPLTPRQLEVAELIARGMSNSQISRQLCLTPGTVANHVQHVLQRLGVHNRAAVASWFTREQAMAGAVARQSRENIGPLNAARMERQAARTSDLEEYSA